MPGGTYWDLKGILSEIRSNYNCFDEEEEPYYRALSDAIRLISAKPEVTEEEVKEYCRKRCLSIVDSALLKKYASAEPERKTGKWLPDNRPGGGFWVCSCCKFPSEAFAANVLYKFCPNCGAYMKGGERENR